MLHPTRAEGSLARELNFGSLEDQWQGHLNDFFNHSKEHALPWTVEGNLEPLTTTLDDDASAMSLSNTVQVWPFLVQAASRGEAQQPSPQSQHESVCGARLVEQAGAMRLALCFINNTASAVLHCADCLLA
jgi:hypothetical protein